MELRMKDWVLWALGLAVLASILKFVGAYDYFAWEWWWAALAVVSLVLSMIVPVPLQMHDDDFWSWMYWCIALLGIAGVMWYFQWYNAFVWPMWVFIPVVAYVANMFMPFKLEEAH